MSQIRLAVSGGRTGSYLLRRDESNLALAQFLFEAENFPVEIGMQLVCRDGECPES